jgi:hypothetical protein
MTTGTRSRLAVAALGSLLAWTAAAAPCAACSCADLSGHEQFGYADAVFRGVVLRHEQPAWWEHATWQLWLAGVPGVSDEAPEPRAILRVAEVWKGAPGKDVAVKTMGMCGVPMRVGLDYVVYAFRDEYGDLGTNFCSPTVGEDQSALFLGLQVSLGEGTPVAGSPE